MTQLEKFIYEHGEELLRLAYTYVKNKQAAEDVVQDVLLRAFEKQEEFRGEATYRTYLYRMTINRSYDYLRSWHYKNTIVGETIQRLFGRLTEQDVVTQSENRQLAQAVLALPLKYREVIVFTYYYDYSSEEIGELLNCSSATVRTRLARGREKLKLVLKEGGFDGTIENGY
ncbi:sigma-70 family RNA polymerase sigma factor [Psychrobacillus sp. NPDC096426]|uniref:sigma-70 family RNA polymerase sigma factor n=1 Tax=Psychrobacillus sp. NPDC096426 TaxID=3364491 RepID=UPI00382839F5